MPVALVPSNLDLVSKEGQDILLFTRNERVDRHTQAAQNMYTIGIAVP